MQTVWGLPVSFPLQGKRQFRRGEPGSPEPGGVIGARRRSEWLLINVLPVGTPEQSTQPSSEGWPLIMCDIHFNNGRSFRCRKCFNLGVRQGASHHGRGDLSDLITIDKPQAVTRLHRDPIEEVKLRKLQHMVNCAELLSG